MEASGELQQSNDRSKIREKSRKAQTEDKKRKVRYITLGSWKSKE
jgi:hypothetical protein